MEPATLRMQYTRGNASIGSVAEALDSLDN